MLQRDFGDSCSAAGALDRSVGPICRSDDYLGVDECWTRHNSVLRRGDQQVYAPGIVKSLLYFLGQSQSSADTLQLSYLLSHAGRVVSSRSVE